MNLSDIKNWVFDLDNTLYSPEEDIFSQIDKRMTEFIISKFNVNEEEAFNIQKKYFLEYGTTLSGLMKRENIDPDEFLEFVHDINLEILKPNIELSKIIKNLPGDKFIFTNGSKKHAENVLKQLEMSGIFDDIFDIKESNFIPKPNINAYLNFIDKTKIEPDVSIMFEDIGRNLEAAKKLGMKTVLIKRNVPMRNDKFKTKDFESLWEDYDFADCITDDLVKFFNNYYI
ncbi:MAG: pyrimidine 5'-nucleotidase [Rhodobiaceae bacterium]|jgi:putative hydrolase of the HAD superfamily|nr:pyrimidine 5'-nucleotidase [Rhodobiaceae bacterium]MDP6879135.1 pyrimidine 5'-nucleotidase [Candidatus Neomarinimicrobiota bacterium]MED5253860.1 pyrimidine 5'-nucleotidase [Pseudomonadota bacterium]|tara:strand:- start:1021 stop:1707 length:687 start_codon:yes stop_codon:yes gene_type:complete